MIGELSQGEIASGARRCMRKHDGIIHPRNVKHGNCVWPRQKIRP